MLILTKKNLFVVLLMIIGLIVFSISAFYISWFSKNEVSAIGTAYYVSSANGLDLNNGTVEQPFKTISYALTQLQPGDTLYLESGNYSDEQITFNISGTVENPISIIAEAGANPIINYNNTDFESINVTGSNLIITGLNISNIKDDCVKVSGNNIRLSDLEISKCTGRGVSIVGNNVTLEKSKVFNNDGGIYVYGISNFTLDENFIYDNYDFNIEIDNSNNININSNLFSCSISNLYLKDGKNADSISIKATNYVTIGDNLANIKIVNNLFGFCNHQIYFDKSVSSESSLNNFEIYHNTFWNSDDYSVKVDFTTGTDLRFINNYVAQQDNLKAVFETGLNIDTRNNYWVDVAPEVSTNANGIGDLVGEADMQNSPTYNQRDSFKLNSSSDAIDSAIELFPALNVDAFGRNRPEGVSNDIGAYEFSVADIPVDFISPILDIDFPQNNSQINKSTQIEIKASATDNKAVIKVEFIIGGEIVCTDTDPINSDLFICTWNSPAQLGNQVLAVKAYDAYGNITEKSITFEIINPPDITPPSILVISPINNANLTITNQTTFSANITDNVGISKVEYLIDGNQICLIVNPPYDCVWNVAGSIGTHTLQIIATDISNNTQSKNIMVNLISPADNIKPSISIIKPVNNFRVLKNTVFEFRINASDNVNVVKVEFYFKNNLICTDFGTTYSCDVSSGNQEGTFKIKAIAYDAYNSSPIEYDVIVVSNLDDQPPTLSVTSPQNMSSYPIGNTVTISANASDNIGVTKVEFFSGNTLLCTDTTSPYTCNWSLSGFGGNYDLIVNAHDASGNKSTQNITVVTYKPDDKIAPMLFILSPITAAKLNPGQSIEFTAKSSDNVGVAKIEFYNGTNLLCVDNSYPYSCGWTAPQNAGQQILLAKSYDGAGNMSSAFVTVLVGNIVYEQDSYYNPALSTKAEADRIQQLMDNAKPARDDAFADMILGEKDQKEEDKLAPNQNDESISQKYAIRIDPINSFVYIGIAAFILIVIPLGVYIYLKRHLLLP